MGNTPNPTEHTPQSQQQLQILYQSELGQVTQTLCSPTQYLIRQLSFGTPEAVKKVMCLLSKFQNIPHPTLLSLLHFESKKISNICGSEYRIRMVFEYSAISIYDEIEARRAQGQGQRQGMRYFQYGDCVRMVVGCVRALGEIEGLMGTCGELVGDGILNRVFVNPERMFIMKDGLVKLMTPLVVSPYDRFHHRQNCYYSPQKLSDFDYPQDQKSCVFQLGLTLLHILSLSPCTSVYNGFQVRQDEIDKLIFSVWEQYQDTLLCEILSRMTRVFRGQRAGLRECVGLGDMLEVRLLDREMGKNCSSNERGEGSGRGKLSQPRSEIFIEQYSPAQCSAYDQDKQNIMLNSNRAASSLKYSQFSSSNQKSMLPISNTPRIHPKKFQCLLSLPMTNKSQQKQSCIITNQSPLLDLAMIVSDVGGGKESYCYGNQLTEGIIQEDLGEDRDVDIGKEGKKFQWKRTQFNKKQSRLSKKKQKRRANLQHINQLIRTEMKTKCQKTVINTNNTNNNINAGFSLYQQIDIYIERKIQKRIGSSDALTFPE